MGQLELIEERAAIRFDTGTMWASREWQHFQRRKLANSNSIVHCECGTGCDACYGEPHCGCPYCYRPPKKQKKKKKKMKMSRIEKVELLLEHVFVIPSLIYQSCQLSETMEKAIAYLNIINLVSALRLRKFEVQRRQDISVFSASLIFAMSV